jgi:WD40 repeat protein
MKIHFTYEATDVSFSTYYKNICAVSTMEMKNWYHNGSIYIIDTVESKILQKFDNKIASNKICWSEHFTDLILSANHDGTFNLININNKKTNEVLSEEGYRITSLDWNNLKKEFILIGSESSRIQLFDGSNLTQISKNFAEHTKCIHDVK